MTFMRGHGAVPLREMQRSIRERPFTSNFSPVRTITRPCGSSTLKKTCLPHGSLPLPRGRLFEAHASETHLLGCRPRQSTKPANRLIKPPVHAHVRPADPSVLHCHHIACNICVHTLQRLTNLLARFFDELKVGAAELTPASHSYKVTAWVCDLLPSDERVRIVEHRNMSIATIRPYGGCNPVDLTISVLRTNLTSRLGP